MLLSSHVAAVWWLLLLCAIYGSGSQYNEHVTYHLISYASSEYYKQKAVNLLTSALDSGIFDHTRLYSQEDLDPTFVAMNAHILTETRGAGYWIWKSYIIYDYMNNVAEKGSIVCYLDAAASPFSGTVNLRSYLWNWTATSPHVGMPQTKPDGIKRLEKSHTNQDAFLLMNIAQPNNWLYQVWAGFVFVRNTFAANRFIAEWLTYSQDMRLITDTPSGLNVSCLHRNIIGSASASVWGSIDSIDNMNALYVMGGSESVSSDGGEEVNVRHRHDQSILSLLAMKWNIVPVTLPFGLFMSDYPQNDALIDQVRNDPELFAQVGVAPNELQVTVKFRFKTSDTLREPQQIIYFPLLEVDVPKVVLRMCREKMQLDCPSTFQELMELITSHDSEINRSAVNMAEVCLAILRRSWSMQKVILLEVLSRNPSFVYVYPV